MASNGYETTLPPATRRAIFDLRRQITDITGGGGSGGGSGNALNEVFIGDTDPGFNYELWYDPDGVPAVPWTSLSYVNGWVPLGTPWALGSYRRMGDIVSLRGLVSNPTPVTNLSPAVIAVLPTSYAPRANEIFGCNTAGQGGYGMTTVRLEVHPNGYIQVVAQDAVAQAPHSYTSLSGVSWSVN